MKNQMTITGSVKHLGKGFYISPTGNGGNRAIRRAHLNTKGLHNPKKFPVLMVDKTSKSLLWVQRITWLNKETMEFESKEIEHMQTLKNRK